MQCKNIWQQVIRKTSKGVGKREEKRALSKKPMFIFHTFQFQSAEMSGKKLAATQQGNRFLTPARGCLNPGRPHIPFSASLLAF